MRGLHDIVHMHFMHWPVSLDHRVAIIVRPSRRLPPDAIAVDFLGHPTWTFKSEAIRLNTRACNAALEKLVVRHPEQWYWVHRRWKHVEGKRKRRATAAKT